MPTENELRGLLGAILRSQPDLPGRYDERVLGDDAGLRDALTGRQALSDAQRSQLLRSPQARERLMRVATTLRAETRAHWQRAGVVAELAYQAAADDEVRPVSVDGNRDFGVSLLPLDPQGRRWTVSLRLSRRVMAGLAGQDLAGEGLAGQGLADLGPAGQVRLLDSGGGLWLQGRPDSDGELSGDWALDESPLLRLRLYTLSIEPL